MKFNSSDTTDVAVRGDERFKIAGQRKGAGANYQLSCLSSLGSLLAKRQDALLKGDKETVSALDARIELLRKGYRN